MPAKSRPAQERRSERIPIHFTPTQVAIVDAWQHENRIPTRAKAVRLLMVKGYEAAQREKVQGAGRGGDGV